ncbi:MAG: SUMF1/EgtB/PvdO family nonheme iron enzyme [Anaerolineae bacterium]|nr:SUMF1/EgtB/PvdO family nonheme iron enzyme [Anaerolineae bacterium]
MATKQRIDVFISSTSIDLPDYRKAVQDAILSLGLHPSGMEHWPVAGENPVDLCRKMVFDAEIYLGIYAHRYGWRPDGDTSITEMEYDWAADVRRDGKPIPRLCFIMADSHPWPKDKMELDALDALNDFKKRVKENQVGFFTTPDDLKAQVTAALAQYRPNTPLTAAIPYLRWLHGQSKQSGLLKALNPRDASSDAKPITVEQVYTPLDTRHIVTRDETTGRILASHEIEEMKRDDEESKKLQQTPMTAMEAASMLPQLVLLGDPGSGKSTFVNFLALCLSGHLIDSDGDWLEQLQKQGWTAGEKLPVLVTLRDFAQDSGGEKGTAGQLFDHIQRQLAKWALDEAFPVIESALNEGRAVVLLDGLDEVPDEKRDWLREAVTDFMVRCHADNRYLVTCRILSYSNPEWRIPVVPEQTIAGFDEDKISHFIGAWYNALVVLKAIDPQMAQQRITDLTEGLNHPHLGNIASNPMLLTVMAIVHNHTGALPRENARLYAQCVELLMLKWRPVSARSLLETLNVREDDLYRMLWKIAYEAHDQQAEREGAADISQADVIAIAAEHLNGDMGKAQEFCDYIEERAGLLIGRGSAGRWRVFAFPHRTFQEFLAGCYVANDRFTRRLPELARKGTGWREALLLAVGHLVFNRGDIATPLDGISAMCPERLRPETDNDWRVIWLAGDMLALIGLTNVERDEVGKEVLPRVRQRLAELVGGGHLPPVERAAAGRTLAVLGDPRKGVGVIFSPRPEGKGQGVRAIPDIDWVEIPAGSFLMGSDKEKDPQALDDELPQHEITLPTYYISRYPISYIQFQAFIDDPDGYHNPQWWEGLGVDEEYRAQPGDQAFKFDNHPRERVSWFDAVAFCRWLTARYVGASRGTPLPDNFEIALPTEVEWEKAARGTEGLIYPYGNEYDSVKANTADTGISQTSSVGMFPEGHRPMT